jgi:hypothetical protein
MIVITVEEEAIAIVVARIIYILLI